MLEPLCSAFPANPLAARSRVLAWLGEGAGKVAWAVGSVPPERWAEPPIQPHDAWPAVRHVRHLALRATLHTLPTVRRVLGEPDDRAPSDWPAFQRAHAEAGSGPSVTIGSASDPTTAIPSAWDPTATIASAWDATAMIPSAWDATATRASAWDATAQTIAETDHLVRTLGEARFELLERVEAAPDDAWHVDRLDRVLLDEYQHELEHLSALWKLALYWDTARSPTAAAAGLPLHPADRLEEPH